MITFKVSSFIVYTHVFVWLFTIFERLDVFLVQSQRLPLDVIYLLLIIGNVEANPGPSQYACKFCQDTFVSLGKYVTHQSDHTNARGFTYWCPICPVTSTSENGLNVHLSRFHPQQKSSQLHSVGPGPSQKCSQPECKFLHDSVAALCHHLFSHFNDEEGQVLGQAAASVITVACPYEKCGKMHSSSGSFKTHLSRYHKGWLGDQSSSYNVGEAVNISAEEPMDVDVLGENLIGASVSDASCEETSFETGFRSTKSTEATSVLNYISEFYLNLTGGLLLADSTVDSISKSLAVLSGKLQVYFQSKLIEELKALGHNSSTIRDVVNKMFMGDPFYNSHHKEAPGPSFTSSYLRKKNFDENYTYIEPIEYNLSNDPLVKEPVMYVPIRKTIEALLEDPSVHEQVEKSFTRTSDATILTDFTSGSVFQSGVWSEKKCITVLLFQDGVNLVNPIGSRKQKHLITGVYMSLGNIDPKLRCKVISEHLVMLFYERLLKDKNYNHEEIFKQLLNDLIDLFQNGVKFKGETIYVYFVFLLGDNLGQHIIGGYLRGFRAEYFCRYCIITTGEFRAKPYEVKSLRTKEEYDACVKEVEDKGLASYKGIALKCVFNKIPYWHAALPGLPPCNAHDLLLGVVDYDLTLIIRYLVSQKWFTYEFLNMRIAQFSYVCRDSNNKPAPVKDEGERLGGHAAQNETLLHLLPFFIWDCIKDPQNKVWQLYLKMKKLVELVNAPEIHITQVAYLKVLVEEYLAERSSLFNTPLKPKHHYLAHYADLIMYFGPLPHLGTLKFERKHQIFKIIARRCKNFINLPLTLSRRHQYAFAHSKTSPCYDPRQTVNKATPLILEMLDETRRSILESSCCLSPLALLVDSVTAYSVQYKNNMWISLNAASDKIVSVGKIDFIVFDDGDTTFLVKQYSASFKHDLGIFEISEENYSYCCVKMQDVKGFPLSAYDFNDNLCFSLRHVYPYDISEDEANT